MRNSLYNPKMPNWKFRNPKLYAKSLKIKHKLNTVLENRVKEMRVSFYNRFQTVFAVLIDGKYLVDFDSKGNLWISDSNCRVCVWLVDEIIELVNAPDYNKARIELNEKHRAKFA